MKLADTATDSEPEKDRESAPACAVVALPNLHRAGRKPQKQFGCLCPDAAPCVMPGFLPHPGTMACGRLCTHANAMFENSQLSSSLRLRPWSSRVLHSERLRMVPSAGGHGPSVPAKIETARCILPAASTKGVL